MGIVEIGARMDGAELVLGAISRAMPLIGDRTSEVMAEVARDVRDAAKDRAGQGHVHNLWRRPGSGRRITPSYRATQKGLFMWKVETGGGAAGRAEAIAEFAREGVTPQGGALGRNLDAAWGKPGRILWRSYDDMSAELAERFERAAEEAMREIEKETA